MTPNAWWVCALWQSPLSLLAPPPATPQCQDTCGGPPSAGIVVFGPCSQQCPKKQENNHRCEPWIASALHIFWLPSSPPQQEPSYWTWWIVILDGPLLDSMSDYGKCNNISLLFLYLSQFLFIGIVQFEEIPLSSNIQKEHHHGGAFWQSSGVTIAQ